MANYRPKSLDELNSFYDKTLSSQNVIKDNISAINSDTFNEPVVSPEAIDEFFAEQTDISDGPAGDLSEDISRFVADFGKPATKEDEMFIRRRPVPVQLKAAPPVPRPVKTVTEHPEAEVSETEPVVETAKEQKSEKAEKAEKAEFVMTAEKSELFEEYMRIMSDEDDDADYSKPRGKKKKKSRKGAEVISDSDADISTVSFSEPEPTPSVPENDEADDSDDFNSFADEAPTEEAEAKTPDSFLTDNADNNELAVLYYDDDEPEVKPAKKNVALQMLLIVALLVTLLSALAATVIQVVVKVNSGEAFADNYYIYTASETDVTVDINEGDLIIAEKTETNIGDVFAFTNSSTHEIDFAVKTFSEGSQITTGENGNGPVRIFNTELRGRVTTIYPGLGSAVSFISENFMVVIAALLILALAIILVLAFAFGRSSRYGSKAYKDNFSFDEDEDYDETDDEDLVFSEKKTSKK